MPAKEVKTNVLFIFSYQSCIRQEAGYCCIEYSVSNKLFTERILSSLFYCNLEPFSSFKNSQFVTENSTCVNKVCNLVDPEVLLEGLVLPAILGKHRAWREIQNLYISFVDS